MGADAGATIRLTDFFPHLLPLFVPYYTTPTTLALLTRTAFFIPFLNRQLKTRLPSLRAMSEGSSNNDVSGALSLLYRNPITHFSYRPGPSHNPSPSARWV
jgi:hypothetical protein